jgi:peptidoglycan/LPS O-acetylase OafA/YrhL
LCPAASPRRAQMAQPRSGKPVNPERHRARPSRRSGHGRAGSRGNAFDKTKTGSYQGPVPRQASVWPLSVPSATVMKRDLSAFLDLTRTLAAFTVFLAHLFQPQFGGTALSVFGELAHSAVIVFFVLSGFVISRAAERNRGAREYILNRASRIYSVALPALALTWITDNLLILYYPGTINLLYQYAAVWKYLPLFLTFSTDFWFLSEDAFSNIPYWSLCYEVWYYVIFGVLIFGRGFWRWGIAIACLLMMGPRLWLLWPIWLAGAYLHRLPPLPRGTSRALLFLSLSGLAALKVSGLEDFLNNLVDQVTGGFATAHLRYSRFFLGDYLVAILVAGAIHAARGADMAALARAQKPIAAAASISFSMYLLHYPLFLFFGALFPRQAFIVGLLTLSVIIVFGVTFERHKTLLKAVFAALWPPKDQVPAYR